MKRLITIVEALPPELQTRVYEYALSLQKASLPQDQQDQPLILDMYKGILKIAEDFDEPLFDFTEPR